MKKEIYIDIKGYEGLYQVSNYGNIKSLPRKKCRGCILKTYYPQSGYPHVMLSKNGIQKCYKVHRLVAEAFIQNPDKKPEVNHKNAIKSDNRVENLEWCTSFENYAHARDMGLFKPENWNNGTYLNNG
ncbi:MAG: NUMOD4 motif-containing HNH endonuclease [Ruminococcus sp.]|nr:NUMOD4 motif-containing HNH endonuclease [Ruminococcus sp.]